MKNQISLPAALDKVSFNNFGNRQRGEPSRAGSNSKKVRRAISAVLCASLLLTLFCWTSEQAVKADTHIGTVAVGSAPAAMVVNPVTNKIYTANFGSANVTAITPVQTNAIPLNTAVTPVANNTVNTSTPTFSLTATTTYSPNAPQPQNIYFQVDTLIRPFLRATEQSRTATTLTANATTPSLQPGIHILYFFAADGSDATSINPRPSGEKYNDRFDTFAPQSSAIIGGINAYLFLVAPIDPTAASVTVGGRVLSSAGRGLAQARVTMTDRGGETRSAQTNAFGYFRFDEVQAGETYIISVLSKRYEFAPQMVTVSEEISDLNFTAEP